MGETTSWENPLMPNARLRQIYLAMMQARTIARSTAPKRGQRSLSGLEACLVSAVIDLGMGDVVSDVLSGPAMDFLRGVTPAGMKRRKLIADCGNAAKLPALKDSVDRIWTAMGAAAALKSLAARAKLEADAAQQGVVVLYMLQGEVAPAFLRKMFTLAHTERLPIIFVVLPTPASAGASRACDLALRCGVPGIPTDAADAVALYRVSQESIGHARIGGGPALIDCVRFAMPGKRGAALDALLVLAQYMLPRKVVTQAWVDRETKAFARRLKALTEKA